MTDVLLTLLCSLSSIVETPGCSPNRDRRPPSPNQRPQTLRSQPSQTSTLRPTFLDMGVKHLARLALRSCPRETGNSRRLASQRFPILLDLEKPARPSRETFGSQGRPRAGPQHEQSQSALGSSAGSWRNPQTRNRALAGDRRQVHGPASKATLANLAHVSQKSQQRNRLDGLLHGSNHYVPHSLRIPSSGSRPAEGAPLQRYPSSNFRMVSTAAFSSLSMGHGATISRARPRCDLR